MSAWSVCCCTIQQLQNTISQNLNAIPARCSILLLSSTDGALDTAGIHNCQTTAALLQRPSSACGRRLKKIQKNGSRTIWHTSFVSCAARTFSTNMSHRRLMTANFCSSKHVRQHPIQRFVPPFREGVREYSKVSSWNVFSCTTSSCPHDSCGRERPCKISASP